MVNVTASAKDSSLLQQFISSVAKGDAPEPNVKVFPDATYTSWRSLGISLCFTTVDGKEQLDSIDIFNGHPKDKFAAYSGTLPLGIESSSQAHDIVSKPGEPIKKAVVETQKCHAGCNMTQIKGLPSKSTLMESIGGS